MFESSKDILYIVLAFVALWVAIFLCWALYYVAQILKNANEMVEEIKERAHRLEEAVRMIRDRMETLSSSFGFVAQGITRIVGKFVEKKMHLDDEDEQEEERPRATRRK